MSKIKFADDSDVFYYEGDLMDFFNAENEEGLDKKVYDEFSINLSLQESGIELSVPVYSDEHISVILEYPLKYEDIDDAAEILKQEAEKESSSKTKLFRKYKASNSFY